MSLPHQAPVCDVSWFRGPEAAPDAPPDLFIELPHGAVTLAELERAKALVRTYPGPDHDLFFLANTDQGSPEYGTHVARLLTGPEHWRRAPERDAVTALCGRLSVLVVRAHLPRTILDVNRVWAGEEEAGAAGLTRGVPDFVTHADDLAALKDAFDRYHAVVAEAYASVVAAGGFALNLHTYAPISVSPVPDEYIVDTLWRAYRTENYGTYPTRPLVELITTPPDGDCLVDPALRDALIAAYAAVEVEAVCDSPFNLHPATMAHTYAARYPGRTLTVELRRDTLAEPFDPFVEMVIAPERVEHMARPIARACLAYLQAR